jgi:hypothetical protein
MTTAGAPRADIDVAPRPLRSLMLLRFDARCSTPAAIGNRDPGGDGDDGFVNVVLRFTTDRSLSGWRKRRGT